MITILSAISWWFWPYLLVVTFVCWAFLRLAIKHFPKWGWRDRQEAHSIHAVAKPRGGGIVIAALFFASLPLLLPWDQKLLGFIIGGILIVAINFIDDKYKVPWWLRLFVEIIACGVVVLCGIELSILTNPITNQVWFLAEAFPLLTKLLTIVWIIVSINMMNWIDAVDGLVTGVGTISALTLFGLCLLPIVNQPGIAAVSLLLAVLALVFLYFNFFPSKIILGDTGATFFGFVLAILAIFSSTKVATFFLVLGIPLLDVVWVVGRRILVEKKSPMQGDKKHLQHRLMNLGLTSPQICYVFYSIAASFGLLSLVLQGARAKLIAVIIMCVFALGFFTLIYILERRKGTKLGLMTKQDQ